MPDGQEGGCLCGAVRFRVTGRLRDVTNCHCGMCRKWHGHVGAYTAASREAFSYVGDGRPRWYQSSSFGRRGFCATCGSSLFWENPDEPHIGIAAGSLDGATGLSTVKHIHVEDRGDYYAL
jgi:hypothetical protein